MLKIKIWVFFLATQFYRLPRQALIVTFAPTQKSSTLYGYDRIY